MLTICQSPLKHLHPSHKQIGIHQLDRCSHAAALPSAKNVLDPKNRAEDTSLTIPKSTNITGTTNYSGATRPCAERGGAFPLSFTVLHFRVRIGVVARPGTIFPVVPQTRTYE